MDWLLRRNFWMVKLFGALMVSAFLANTTTTLLGVWLFRSIPEAVAAEAELDEDEVEDAELDAALASTASSKRRDPERIGAEILGRNVFCPECKPDDLVATPDGPVASGELPAFDGAQRSALPLELAATMEASDPSASLATIRNVEAGRVGIFAVGDELSAGVQLVAVAGGRIDILNAGRPEYISTGPAPKVAPPPKTTGKPPARSTPDEPPKNQIPGAEDAIKCDAGGCQVDRSFVESLIAKPQLLVGQGMARPAKTAGGEDGFRLAGVKKGSLPDLLGLKSGDIITEVGGQALTYDSLMALYPKLRNAKNIEVTVDRRGERISRALEIS